MKRRADVMRRYPAMVFLLVAGFLATLLPSALRIPLAGPSSTAEVAPVPGQGSNASNLDQLGAASSGALGFGSGSGGVGGVSTTTTMAPPVPSGTGGNPRSKRCVGRPPRQTEDRQSPPCVPFFRGDNGGATMRGVTRDEIVVVIHQGQATTEYPAGFHDWLAPIEEGEGPVSAAGKAFARYFTERYQLYGRKLHLYGYTSNSPMTPAGWKADVAAIDAEKRPFAILGLLDGVSFITKEAASRGIFASAYPAFSREAYQSVAPYLLSYNPDLEDQAAMSASYICTKLVNRTAKWSPDPAIAGRTRKFGLLFTDGDDEPEYRTLRVLLRNELARQCSITPVEASFPTGTGQSGNHASALATLRINDVTTVITVMTGGGAGAASNIASAETYYPEWFVPGGGAGSRGPDRNGAAQVANQAAWDGAFGITFDYRRDAPDLQPWNQAYREGCPTCPDIRRNDIPELYDALALLAYGIQSAGPHLTPESFDQGMHAIDRRPSPSPYQPAAYFSPGNYSFVKDAAEIWWDTGASAPGATRPGCYRMVGDGRRVRAGEWTGDDTSVFTGAPACQGNTVPGPA